MQSRFLYTIYNGISVVRIYTLVYWASRPSMQVIDLNLKLKRFLGFLYHNVPHASQLFWLAGRPAKEICWKLPSFTSWWDWNHNWKYEEILNSRPSMTSRKRHVLVYAPTQKPAHAAIFKARKAYSRSTCVCAWTGGDGAGYRCAEENPRNNKHPKRRKNYYTT